jgi:hypothetical protein
LTWTNDLDTGFYNDTANIIKVSSGATNIIQMFKDTVNSTPAIKLMPTYANPEPNAGTIGHGTFTTDTPCLDIVGGGTTVDGIRLIKLWDDVVVNMKLTVGAVSRNTSYPIHVQTTGLNNISIYSAGDIAALSDAKFKTDLQVIDGALDKMDLIHGYTFKWIRDKDNIESKRSAGVIAQELETVLPEVVGIDPETGDRNVSYGNMNALLIQAIKELKERVIRLEAQISNSSQ